jgi:hypothetical protein
VSQMHVWQLKGAERRLCGALYGEGMLWKEFAAQSTMLSIAPCSSSRIIGLAFPALQWCAVQDAHVMLLMVATFWHASRTCSTKLTTEIRLCICLQASHAGEGGIWVDGSSASLGKDAGVSSAYTGSLSREQAVLKLQAGARGFLTRKQIRLQRQQQGDALVLVQVRAACCCVGRLLGIATVVFCPNST